jgi:hypothetical protein
MFRRKPKAEEPRRKPSPKVKRSRAEVEKRRRFIVEVVIVITILAAVGLVGYGYYDTQIKPWHQNIVRVNDEAFNMRYYVKMLRLWGVGSSGNWSQDIELAQSVATVMIDYELLRQAAASPEFSIKLTDEEVGDRLRAYSGFDGNTESIEDFNARLQAILRQYGLSWSDLEDMLIKPMLIQEKLRQIMGERDYASGVPVEYVRVQAMLVTGSDNATAAREEWLSGEDFDQLLKDFSPSKSYGKLSNGVQGEWMPRGMGESSLEAFAFGDGSGEKFGLISDPIEDSEQEGKFWLVRVLGKQVMPLTQDDRDVLIGNAYREWLEDEKEPESNVIVNYLEGASGFDKIFFALDHLDV